MSLPILIVILVDGLQREVSEMSRPDDYGIVAGALREMISHLDFRHMDCHDKALAALERLAIGEHHELHGEGCRMGDISPACRDRRRDCLAKVRG
jgi:hypothetical protein